MTSWIVRPQKGLKGDIVAPPSKSHSLRAVLFASLATGQSILRHLLPSPDLYAMVRACEQVGAGMTWQEGELIVTGTGGKLRSPDDVIDAGNSGMVLRFVGALAGLIPSYTVITGDHSIRHRRPAKPLLEAMQQLGATAESMRGDGHAPLILRGPMRPGAATLRGEDSQPISGLLFAASFLEGPTELIISNPGEKPWIDLSLYWFRRFGLEVNHTDYTHYRVQGGSHIEGFELRVPGDWSSAAFPIAAALLTDSKVTINNIDPEDPQGDKLLVPLLQSMGAQIEQKGHQLTIKGGQSLQGREIDVNPVVDALPLLAVIATFAKGTTRLYNGAVAREKECDRIACICCELKRMGAAVEEHPDGLTVHHSALVGARVQSHEDHRIAMALSVAALTARGETVIESVDCVRKTYPNFVETMHALGAPITKKPHPPGV